MAFNTYFKDRVSVIWKDRTSVAWISEVFPILQAILGIGETESLLSVVANESKLSVYETQSILSMIANKSELSIYENESILSIER